MTTATHGPANAPAFAPSPDLYPFASRWLDSSAGRVHYVDEGAGRPILTTARCSRRRTRGSPSPSCRARSTSSSRTHLARSRRRSRGGLVRDEPIRDARSGAYATFNGNGWVLQQYT